MGLSEGALVLNAVQGAAGERSDRSAAGSTELRDVRRPAREAPLRGELPDPDVPRRQRRARDGLPHPRSGREPVPHRPVRLRLRQHRRLPRPAGQPVCPRQHDRRAGDRSHRGCVHQPEQVPPQNIRTTVNSKGATTTTYLVPEQHLPLVLAFKYLGYDEDTLNQLDAILMPTGECGLFAQRRPGDRTGPGGPGARLRPAGGHRRPTRRRSAAAATRYRR